MVNGKQKLYTRGILMSRPKGSKNKKTLEAEKILTKATGKVDYDLPEFKKVYIDRNPDVDKIFPKEKVESAKDLTVVESGKPEYHEDGTIKISGRYDKLINGIVFLYCYGNECWKDLRTCNEICHKENCPSRRLYQGNPIIHRRTQREMKKGKKK
jgi:hypothetical protein